MSRYVMWFNQRNDAQHEAKAAVQLFPYKKSFGITFLYAVGPPPCLKQTIDCPAKEKFNMRLLCSLTPKSVFLQSSRIVKNSFG